MLTGQVEHIIALVPEQYRRLPGRLRRFPELCCGVAGGDGITHQLRVRASHGSENKPPLGHTMLISPKLERRPSDAVQRKH